jgi:hypothetical protein
MLERPGKDELPAKPGVQIKRRPPRDTRKQSAIKTLLTGLKTRRNGFKADSEAGLLLQSAKRKFSEVFHNLKLYRDHLEKVLGLKIWVPNCKPLNNKLFKRDTLRRTTKWLQSASGIANLQFRITSKEPSGYRLDQPYFRRPLAKQEKSYIRLSLVPLIAASPPKGARSEQVFQDYNSPGNHRR